MTLTTIRLKVIHLFLSQAIIPNISMIKMLSQSVVHVTLSKNVI